jgi:hypothetical protein
MEDKMSTEIIEYDNGFSPPTLVDAPESSRRIADLIAKVGKREINVEPLGNKNIPADEYLSIMLWDLITTGEAHFAGGENLIVEDLKDWQALVRFVSGHLDGPVGKEGMNNFNFFKVYQGFDPDQV